MDEKIVYLIIGAIISLVSTLFGVAIQAVIKYFLDRKGGVKIYRKLVYVKNSNKQAWGVSEYNDDKLLQIPMWIEIHNTQNVGEIIRDFNLVLFKDGKQLCNLVQANSRGEDWFYGDKGTYSFVLPPKKIQRYDLHFMLKKSDMPQDFDEIKVTYFNSKDKKIEYPLIFEGINGWDETGGKLDADWKLIKK